MNWRDKYPPLFDIRYIYRNFPVEVAREIFTIVRELPSKEDGVFSSSWPVSQAIINHTFFSFPNAGIADSDLIRLEIFRKTIFGKALNGRWNFLRSTGDRFDLCNLLSPIETLQFSFDALNAFIYCIEWDDSLWDDSILESDVVEEPPVPKDSADSPKALDDLPF